MVQFVYLMRRHGVSQETIHRMLRYQLIPIDRVRLMPARRDAEAVVAECAASNTRLAARLGKDEAFSQDFSVYPEISEITPLDRDYVQANLLALLAQAKIPPRT